MVRRHRSRWITLALVAALLGGCAQPGAAGGQEAGAPGGDSERLRRQAREALARYDKAVADAGGQQGIVVVGGSTGQVGDWEPDNGMHKEVLQAGRVVATGPLPAAPQPSGEVVWDGGGSRTVAIVSAGDALAQLVAAGVGDCKGCVPLEVTGARLGTARIQTARGPATAPAWEFTLRGTAVKVTSVAFGPATGVKVVPPSWDPYNAPGGLAIESAAVTGTTLTAQFVGAPQPATGPCGIDYTLEIVDSANAIVVIVREHPFPGDHTCTAIGGSRSATVDLGEPLGERAVLEVQQGLPVPVTVAP